METFNELEKHRKEINELKAVIYRQEKFIQAQNNAEDVQKSCEENKKRLTKLENNFTDYVIKIKNTENKVLVDFVNFHKTILNNIRNFAQQKLKQKRDYSEEYLQNISKLKITWNEFLSSPKLPDTHLLDTYELFCSLAKYEKDIKLDISTENKRFIERIEKTRQEIISLTKINFHNDVTLDKGEAWGASSKDIDKAEKEYTVISKKIKKSKSFLQKIIKEAIKEDKNIVNFWKTLHLYTCISIIDRVYLKEKTYNDGDSTRLFVADETFYKWLKIDFKNEFFVVQNIYYLSDYENLFDEIFLKY